MGYGSFNSVSYTSRSTDAGYSKKSVHEVFTQRSVHADMNPLGVTFRESRDSDTSPKAFPIIIGIDVTGSMGRIPHILISEGLPKIMESIMNLGVANPSLCFLAIGDHECDSSPLQIGQFEASDELLEKWLQSIHVEGGGGGNSGESYLLAHDFAANHTITDSWEKRKIKGVLITIGDEPPLNNISSAALARLYGAGQFGDVDGSIISKAKEMWDVYHVNCTDGSQGKSSATKNSWGQLLGNNLIDTSTNGIANTITDIIYKSYKSSNGEVVSTQSYQPYQSTDTKEETVIL